MKYSLRRFAADTDLARSAAAEWVEAITARAAAGRRFSVALSGGRITEALFRETSALSQDRLVPWHAVDFFWADERCVPAEDPLSNFKLASELLLKPLEIPAHNIFRLRGELPQADAVKLANSQLRENVATGDSSLPELDLVFLGMGEDGHIASLFPQAAPAIMEIREPFIGISSSPKPPPQRLTMTYALLAAAKQTWVLISGDSKKVALADALSATPTSPLGKLIQLRSKTELFVV
jgi:6-phosphogluconolactonase